MERPRSYLSFSPATETRKSCHDAHWKCWGDQDAKIGRARVGPEQDWSSHPGRRSLQLPRRVSSVKDTPGVHAFPAADLGQGPGKATTTGRTQKPGCALGPIRVCMYEPRGMPRGVIWQLHHQTESSLLARWILPKNLNEPSFDCNEDPGSPEIPRSLDHLKSRLRLKM